MTYNIEIKPVHGYFGGPQKKIIDDVPNDLGMEDGGLLVKSMANKRQVMPR